STALLVAIDGDARGRVALTIWSDFVLAARGRATTGFGEAPNQSHDCAIARGDGTRTTSGSSVGDGEKERGRRADGGKEQGREDPAFSTFPAVWIVTSDSWIDKTVRECMPHLLPLFVSGVSSDGGKEGPRPRGEGSSWSDVLDRFLSEDSEVKVFGIFGEGALPTAALLPFSPRLLTEASDADTVRGTSAAATRGGGGGCSGGCAIESILWPVLSNSTSPSAVLSRARGWWREDGADGVVGQAMKGEWMPDKFVAQIWCNRGMVETSRRTSDTVSMLQAIQLLIGQPAKIGAVLIDGTKAAPSRYLYPPVAAEPDGGGGRADRAGGGGSGGTEYSFLRRISEHAYEKVDRQRELEDAEDQQRSAKQTSGAPTTRPPTSPAERRPLPEVDFYIGTLQLSLGFESSRTPPDVENAAVVASRTAPAPHDSQTNEVTGAAASLATEESRSGDGEIGDGDGGSESGGEGVVAEEIGLIPARWPPQYILENVQQRWPRTDASGAGHDPSLPFLPFPDDAGISKNDAFREDGQEDDLVIVTNVNCGYLDMATNFLQSVRRAARNVKILFVAMDEVAFDFLDALAPGCTVLFNQEGSERKHSIKAGRWLDQIFKEQTTVRPSILLAIMKQGYRVLWSDADTIWLGNALTVLPVPQDNAIMVMAPLFGPNKCTCFLYLDHTPNVELLLELWIKNLLENEFRHDQVAFQHPLADMQKAGLRLEIVPEEVLPAGNKVFSNNFLKKKYELYKDTILVVHNNEIVGHSAKVQRFRKAGLWEVDDLKFPTC
ncbi:unnamed protein product, partial [Scytosiphon promiscuus]